MLFDSRSPWGTVAVLQRLASIPNIGDRVRGFEEALDAVVGMIALDREVHPSVVKNLCSNRAATVRARRRIAVTNLSANAGLGWRPAEPHARLMLEDVRRLVGVFDFDLLVDVAVDSYQRAAGSRGLAVGTVKARVSRARDRLRAALSNQQQRPPHRRR